MCAYKMLKMYLVQLRKQILNLFNLNFKKSFVQLGEILSMLGIL